MEVRQVGYEYWMQQPMQPTGRGSTPPPIRNYIPPPPAQIPVAQRTQGSISAEQAAQDERNRAANNAASGQPAQRGFTTPQHSGGINDPWQGGHDPWQGTNPGQYQQPNWHPPHSSHTRAAGGNTRDYHTTYPPPQQTPQQVQQQQEQRTRIVGNHSLLPRGTCKCLVTRTILRGPAANDGSRGCRTC